MSSLQKISKFPPHRILLVVGLLAMALGRSEVVGQDAEAAVVATHPIVIELFYRSDSKQSQDAVQFLEQFQAQHAGLEIETYDVLSEKPQLKRLWELSRKFGHKKPAVPTFYLCSSLIIGFKNKPTTSAAIESLLNVDVYVRPGCKHCKASKLFLTDLDARWPAIRIRYHDVIGNQAARVEAQNLVARFQIRAVSFPLVHVAGRVIVGFQSNESTGAAIESFFEDQSPSKTCENKQAKQKESKDETKGAKNSDSRSSNTSPTRTNRNCLELFAYASRLYAQAFRPDWVVRLGSNHETDPCQQDEFRIPEEATDQTIITESDSQEQPNSIDVPVFGRLSVNSLGLPLFTFLIGLVDGFNPCAMWVLIFLLSVLVRIKERKKILIVAGTFVIVSGLAYFVFMTAWFSVFQFVGYLRPVQIGLGVVAIIIGLINVKDFFAFHKGISLSIPESAKPGIYRRVRKIVSSNRMSTALVGAVVLAIIVNFVELLCTAGLPALYTQILTMQELPPWANLSYIGLYIAAYMLDDMVLVGIIVFSLSNRRLQESEGRWLKLLSGAVILALGVVMIFWPEKLI